MHITLDQLLEFTLHCHRTCTVDNPKDCSVTFALNQEYLTKIITSMKEVYTLIPEGKLFLPKDPEIIKRIKPLEVPNPKDLFILFHNHVNKRSITSRVRWPENGIIHESAVIGADGMRWMRVSGVLTKMKHIGAVYLSEGVEVGACTVIHRGTIDDTIIGENVKIGSNCSIGHNCIVGRDTMITAGVNIAGSVRIGEGCWIGVGSAIRDNITICDGVRIGHGSVVTKSITEPGTYFGNPAMRRGEYDGRL